jgi:hypothetical protein
MEHAPPDNGFIPHLVIYLHFPYPPCFCLPPLLGSVDLGCVLFCLLTFLGSFLGDSCCFGQVQQESPRNVTPESLPL